MAPRGSDAALALPDRAQRHRPEVDIEEQPVAGPAGRGGKGSNRRRQQRFTP